jgi:hypothetical protein
MEFIKLAAKNGGLECPQCGKTLLIDLEFDDAGFPIYGTPCVKCEYPENKK